VVRPRSTDIARAAKRILDAFASQRLIPPLSTEDPALDEDSAFAIALEVYARRVRRFEVVLSRDGVQQVQGVGANVLDSRSEEGATRWRWIDRGG